MIVCHCKGITDRDLRRQLDQGVDVQTDEICGREAGGVCGGCRPLLDRVLREYAESSDPPRDTEAH